MREMFETTADRLFKDHMSPQLRESAEGGEWPAALWAAVEAAGFGLALAPEALGGVGARLADAAAVIIQTGRHAVPLPIAEAMIANFVLGLAGVEAVGETLTMSGDPVMERVGKVQGTLRAVPWGDSCRFVLARAIGAEGSRLALLPVAAGNVVQRECNLAREPRATLQFENAVPAVLVALPPGTDDDVLLLAGALIRAAQITGALETVCDIAINYAGDRVQFGKPIAKFQAVQHAIAQIAAETLLARAATAEAFGDVGLSADFLAIPAAKVAAGDAAALAARNAHGVLGAIGFTYEHGLQYYTRRLWSWSEEFGSTTFWSRYLGERAAGLGAVHLWPAVTRGAWSGSVAR